MKEKAKKTIYIIGGGIGGLTLADELSSYSDARVVLIEQKSLIGGMVRSYPIEGKAYTRVHAPWNYSPYYEFFFHQLKSIPSSDSVNVEKHNVFNDHMVDVKIFAVRTNSGETTSISTNIADTVLSRISRFIKVLHVLDHLNLSRLEAITVGLRHLSILFMSPEQLKELHKKNYKEFLGNVSTRFLSFLEGVAAANMKGSALVHGELFLKQILIAYNPHNVPYSNRTWDRSTCEALFKPWYKKLQQQGVEIHTDKMCVCLQTKGKKVTGIVVKDSKNQKEKTITVEQGSLIALATPLQETHQIFEASGIKNVRLPDLPSHSKAACGYIYELNSVPKDFPMNEWVAFPDSPWALVAICFNRDYIDHSLGHKNAVSKPLIWVAISNAEREGVLIKKRFTACSEQEVADEVLAQMNVDKAYVNCAFPGQGLLPDKNIFPHLYVLPPSPTPVSAKTPYSNLFFGASLVDTAHKSPSQEKATEGSRKCAAVMLKKMKQSYPIARHVGQGIYYKGPAVMRILLYGCVKALELAFRVVAKLSSSKAIREE